MYPHRPPISKKNGRVADPKMCLAAQSESDYNCQHRETKVAARPDDSLVCLRALQGILGRELTRLADIIL